MLPTPTHQFLERKITGDFAPEADSSVTLDATRYVSAEYATREWDAVFGKTWLMGCWIDEVAKPGQFHITEIGKKSIIIVRGADGVLRAFHNVCRHRGNLLVRDRKQGTASSFSCSYHRWTWDNTGGIVNIPDRETFPGLPEDCRMGLREIKCDVWAGFVFFCLDPGAISLAEYLGPLIDRFDRYEMAKMRLVHNITAELRCNWKIAVDAFNEAYHIATVHPQLLAISEDYYLHHECHERHSWWTLPWGLTSERMQRRSDSAKPSKALFDYVNAAIAGDPMTNIKAEDYPAEWIAQGFDSATFEGTIQDLWRETQRKKRSKQALVPHLPYKNLTDAELIGGMNVMIFPNIQLNFNAERMSIFRIRPFVDDPSKCYFDMITVAHLPAGHNVPLPPHQIGNAEADLGFILRQDVMNFWSIQAGLESRALDGLYLSEQEIRIRHFHSVLDRYIRGTTAG